MDKALKASLEILIKSKRGFEFEALINQMHLICYGSEGYQPTRERGDEGAEGIVLETKSVVAAYGPDSFDERRFSKKIHDDFDDYITKWAQVNPNWKMHYNGSLPPVALRLPADLKAKAQKLGITTNTILIKGIEQIMQFIEDEFSNRQLRQLACSLGVAKELIIFDGIRSIIDDLIKDNGIHLENVTYDLQINIKDKIELNYSSDDIEIAKEEYENYAIAGTLSKLWAIIATYETEQITALKLRIMREFNTENGTFKEKLNRLSTSYINRYSSGQDDDFDYYTRALLTYCFEQCMIGAKTSAEKQN